MRDRVIAIIEQEMGVHNSTSAELADALIGMLEERIADEVKKEVKKLAKK